MKMNMKRIIEKPERHGLKSSLPTAQREKTMNNAFPHNSNVGIVPSLRSLRKGTKKTTPRAFLALIFFLSATQAFAGLNSALPAETGFLSQPIFTMGVNQGLSASLQGFSQWSSNPSFNLNEDAKTSEWVSVLKNAATPEGQQLLAPILNALNSKAKAQIKGRLNALVSSKSPQRQKILLSQISALLEKGRKKSAARVLESLQKYVGGLTQDAGHSSLSQAAFEKAKALDQILTPLTRIYIRDSKQENEINNLSQILAQVQAQHISKTLEPYWTSGKNPEQGSNAEKLVSDPAYNMDAPRKGPLWLKSAETQKVMTPQEFNLRSSNLQFQFPHIFIPTHNDLIKIGGQNVKRTLFPNVPNGTGDDIPAILAAGNNASNSTQIMLYEETLDEDVASIVQGLKQGKKFEIIADYSNLFPEKMRQRNRTRSPQLQKLVDESNAGNPNLKLYALKGLGSIGIQHAKFRIWNVPHFLGNSQILETGSYNYSTHSQQNNWENVVFIDDKKIIALYQAFFNWAKSVARPYSDDLDPEEPAINSPIPTDRSLGQSFNGTALPIASFSPDGGTGEAWAKIINASKQDALIGMFGFYPWPDLVSTMVSKLNNGLSIRVLSDIRQSHNPASIADMKKVKDAGAEVRVISGAGKTGLFHNKLVIGDGKNGGIVATGSTNMSFNGNRHNFENTVYLKDPYLGALVEYLEALWKIGTEPDYSQLSASQPQGSNNLKR